MSETRETAPPKSMRQKRVLDAAADDPSASIDDLARAVPTATPALVERVLEEYGDPAGEDHAEGSTDEQGAQSDESSTDGTTTAKAKPMDTENESTDGIDSGGQTSSPTEATDGAGTAAQSGVEDPAYLTPAQRETLRAIQANPEATQRALAEDIGVSAATVSQRVNGIEGFEWSERASFVDKMFDSVPSTSGDTTTDRAPTTTSDGGTADSAPATTSDATADTTHSSIAEALTALEAQLETLTEQQTTGTPFEDPELVSKVVHACMDAETISEDEELRIVRAILA